MGKGQSKSYDLSTSTQKANHQRPKSSQQRESLLMSRNSQNLNGDTQVEVNSNKQLEQKGEREGNGLVNAKSESQDKQTADTEVTVESRTENLNSKGDNSDDIKYCNEKPVTDSEDYNSKEESDQIDKALEDYIETQKNKESVESEEEREGDKKEVQKEEVKQEDVVEETENKIVTEEREQIPLEQIDFKEISESKKESDSKQEVEDSLKEETIHTLEVKTEEVNITDTEGEAEVKETPVNQEEDQEGQIILEGEVESELDKREVVEEKPVKESETVQFKTVISLETTPSDSESPSQEGGDIIEPPEDFVPPAEPVVPVEEPTLPESAATVLSEIPSNMSTVESEVCGVDDLKDGEMREVEVGEGKALLVKENGQFYAVGSKCTHYGAPLAKGAYCNGRVRCPWHGACFNVKTGDIEDFPGLDSIPKFEVTVADGKVKVKGDKTQLTSSKVQKTMCKQLEENEKSVLIIGGGPSSVVCAETLRKEGFTGKVTIATMESCVPYDRIKLSKMMDSTAEGLALRNSEFYKTNDIDVLNNKKATAVDTGKKSVSFEDGSSLNYTSLVVATGGKPRQLPIPGANFDNVCLLRTPDDANRINEAAKGKKVVIIGSSFIGMEVAAYMVPIAKSVTVLVRGKAPFENILGLEIGTMIKKLHEDQGVKFHFEKGIKEFVGSENKATEAVLSDDTRLPCDIAVLGVGVVPATDFLKGSGIDMTDRGFIPVDKNMRTNIDGVYAVGDIAEFPLFLADDKQANVQHWGMASTHGKTAALTIAEKPDDIRSVPFFWTMMYKKSIRYTGYGFGYDDIIVHGDLDALSFVAFYTKGEYVVAVATLGQDPVTAEVAEIMHAGQKIFKSEIQNSMDAITEKFAKL